MAAGETSIELVKEQILGELQFERGLHDATVKLLPVCCFEQRQEPTEHRHAAQPHGEDRLTCQDAGLGEGLAQRCQADVAFSHRSRPEQLRRFDQGKQVAGIYFEVLSQSVDISAVVGKVIQPFYSESDKDS